MKRPTHEVKPIVPKEPKKIKICVVGEQASGKTSMCMAYTLNLGEEVKVLPTVGSDFYSRVLDIGAGNRL